MSRRSARVVLGLCAFTHDSAAALIVDGHLVGFCEEERLSGIKHDRSYPTHAIAWLLDAAGLSTHDIDVVAYNFVPARYLPAAVASARYAVRRGTAARALPRARSFVKVAYRTHDRLQQLRARFPHARVVVVPHHRAHGLYAFAASGRSRAAVLVADSLGETATTSIALADSSSEQVHYQQLAALSDPASLGYVYGAVTEHLGWRRGDEEGTVMALAALGDPARFRNLFSDAVRLTETGFTVDPALFHLRVLSGRASRITRAFVERGCDARRPDEPVEVVHRDLAAALQERTEQVMLHLASQAARQTGQSTLCVGGGVAMNCVSIGRITESDLVDEVMVPPAPGDSGTAIGAAIDQWVRARGTLPAGVAGACYLGPSFPDPTIPAATGLRVRAVDRPARKLARELANGTIVGLFTGRLEAGPRALGHRSILASPLDPGVVDRLNATVKYREPFRPFAPVVLADKAADYFSLRQPSPFMSMAAPVTDLARQLVPSIVHTNGTARVQTVDAEQNPLLAEVLTEFEAITGVPVLINTSLNIKGKPICGSPEMALECLTESGIDALLLDDRWVTR